MKEWREGSCHCGRVKFRARRDWSLGLTCNCSVCYQKGFVHGIVEEPADFECLTGELDLTEYRFQTKVARHLFCRHCGISPFYVPRSHPSGFSVNLRCVNGLDLAQVHLVPFDGKNWEQAREDL